MSGHAVSECERHPIGNRLVPRDAIGCHAENSLVFFKEPADMGLRHHVVRTRCVASYLLVVPLWLPIQALEQPEPIPPAPIPGPAPQPLPPSPIPAPTPKPIPPAPPISQ